MNETRSWVKLRLEVEPGTWRAAGLPRIGTSVSSTHSGQSVSRIPGVRRRYSALRLCSEVPVIVIGQIRRGAIPPGEFIRRIVGNIGGRHSSRKVGGNRILP